MTDEKRCIGNYEVTNSIHIGDREFVIGEDMDAKENQHYMLCEVVFFYIFEKYENVVSSNNYLDILKEFTQRLNAQTEKLIYENQKMQIPLEIINKDKCKEENIFN